MTRRANLLGRRSEEPALHERFGGVLRKPQRRNAAASRVTNHRARAAKTRRDPSRIVACASAANTPMPRAARPTPSAARPPRMPRKDTKKKIPSAENESADVFGLI